MALEALGKTGADYKHKALLPPIAAVFKGEIDDRAKDNRAPSSRACASLTSSRWRRSRGR